MLSIFIPGPQHVSQATLDQLGCSPLLDPTVAAMKVDAIVEGPNGLSGWLFYLEHPGGQRKPLVTYNPETQVWVEAAADGDLEPGRYWLGFWKEAPPTPTELERDDVVDGREVQLSDGNSWTIPIADFFPKRLVLDRDTGEEREEVFGKDQAFVERANALFDLFLSNGFQEVVSREHVVRIPNGLRFAADALAVNYRVNRDLVHALGLVGQFQAFDIARVATGLAMVEEANQKKTEPLAVPT